MAFIHNLVKLNFLHSLLHFQKGHFSSFWVFNSPMPDCFCLHSSLIASASTKRMARVGRTRHRGPESLSYNVWTDSKKEGSTRHWTQTPTSTSQRPQGWRQEIGHRAMARRRRRKKEKGRKKNTEVWSSEHKMKKSKSKRSASNKTRIFRLTSSLAEVLCCRD